MVGGQPHSTPDLALHVGRSYAMYSRETVEKVRFTILKGWTTTIRP